MIENILNSLSLQDSYLLSQCLLISGVVVGVLLILSGIYLISGNAKSKLHSLVVKFYDGGIKTALPLILFFSFILIFGIDSAFYKSEILRGTNATLTLKYNIIDSLIMDDKYAPNELLSPTNDIAKIERLSIILQERGYLHSDFTYSELFKATEKMNYEYFNDLTKQL